MPTDETGKINNNNKNKQFKSTRIQQNKIKTKMRMNFALMCNSIVPRQEVSRRIAINGVLINVKRRPLWNVGGNFEYRSIFGHTFWCPLTLFGSAGDKRRPGHARSPAYGACTGPYSVRVVN